MIKFFACKNPGPRPIILYLPAAAAAETGNITWHRKDVYVNICWYPDPHVARSGDKQSSAGGGGGVCSSSAGWAAPGAGQEPEEEQASEERNSVSTFSFLHRLSCFCLGESLTFICLTYPQRQAPLWPWTLGPGEPPPLTGEWPGVRGDTGPSLLAGILMGSMMTLSGVGSPFIPRIW